MAARWSEVPKNLLEDIFDRLCVCDHLGFTSVCSSWRSACLENRYLPRRYVGLIVPGKTPDSETRHLLEPVQGEYNNNDNAFNVPVPHQYYCCGSSFGWLVLINDDLDMQLLNPVSGAKIELPSAGTLMSPSSEWGFKNSGKHYVNKAVLSCDPTRAISETRVLVIFGEYNLAFSIPGDKSWKVIATGKHGPGAREYSDAIFHKEKFYVVYNSAPPPGGVVTCDLSDIENPVVADYAPPPRCEIFNMTRYLVEANGHLFQLRRHVQWDSQHDDDSGYIDDCDDFHCAGAVADGEIDQNEEVGEEDEVGSVHSDCETQDNSNAEANSAADGEVDQNEEVGEEDEVGSVDGVCETQDNSYAEANSAADGEVDQNEEVGEEDEVGSVDGDCETQDNSNAEANSGADGEVDQNEEVDKEDEVESADGDCETQDNSNAEAKKASMYESLRRYRTSHFKVYKLIECNCCESRRWRKVDSIGDYAFFVGYNSSFSLSTSEYLSCKPNSIYFTDSRRPYTDMLEPIRHDVGIFNMEDKSVQDIYPLDSTPMWPPAFWFTPVGKGEDKEREIIDETTKPVSSQE